MSMLSQMEHQFSFVTTISQCLHESLKLESQIFIIEKILSSYLNCMNYAVDESQSCIHEFLSNFGLSSSGLVPNMTPKDIEALCLKTLDIINSIETFHNLYMKFYNDLEVKSGLAPLTRLGDYSRFFPHLASKPSYSLKGTVSPILRPVNLLRVQN
jgi:hypothetical protein